MNKKVFFSVAFFILILLGTVSIVEFYYAKNNDRTPIFSRKTEDRVKQYKKYSSTLYNVYKCYSGTTIVLGKLAKEPVCDRIIIYGDDGYYINKNGLKISKKDYQTIYDVSNNQREIEEFTSDEDIKNALIISIEYEHNLSKPVRTVQVNREVVNIVASKELTSNEHGDYSWNYQTLDDKYYRCEKNGLYKEYSDGKCLGEWKKLEYSDKWCSLSENSNKQSIIEANIKYCK